MTTLTKRLSALGLCLGAMLAIGAVAATVSASAAAPEFGRCAKAAKVGKTYTGGYTNSSCTTASETKTGKYEWLPGAVKNRQTTSGGKALLETVGHLTVACASETSVGEYRGTKEVANVVVAFEGCESTGLHCSTPGAATGEVVTTSLEGIVGYENKALKETALDLYPSGKTGLFVEFACGGLTVSVRGEILVPVKSDKMESTGTLKYKATKGKQELEHLEGGPTEILEASFAHGAYEQASEAITTTLKNEEPLELNAVV